MARQDGDDRSASHTVRNPPLPVAVAQPFDPEQRAVTDRATLVAQPPQQATRRQLLMSAGKLFTGAILGTSAGLALRPVSALASMGAFPGRIADSRSGSGLPLGPLTPGGSPYVVGYSVAGVTSAIIGGTLIATGWNGFGYIYVVPHGHGPVTPYSMLGFGGNAINAYYSGFTCALAPGSSGPLTFDLYIGGANTHVIIDESVLWWT